MNSIEEMIPPYVELETAIRSLMIQLFSETCGMCTACCCRADICEEATESTFLSLLLKKQGLSTEKMDDRIGWLDLNGCLLEYGRPPICYAYYCEELLSRLPDDDARYATRILGNLIDHVGRNALGERHLVEIRNSDELEQIDLDQMTYRIDEAQAALEVIDEYFQTGRFSAADRKTLSAIDSDEP